MCGGFLMRMGMGMGRIGSEKFGGGGFLGCLFVCWRGGWVVYTR